MIPEIKVYLAIPGDDLKHDQLTATAGVNPKKRSERMR